jgi:uncharacterized damage-inducible protein DinB
MSVSIRLDGLLEYSDHERLKWREWLAADPARPGIAMQVGGRFPTANALLDHVFLVERRHLARLEGSTPPDTTGVPPGDIKALFEYAELVRADLRRYLTDLDEGRAGETMNVTLPSGTFAMTRRKLALHIVLHEIRHLAQLALAARTAGHAPPGNHDIFYFESVRGSGGGFLY